MGKKIWESEEVWEDINNNFPVPPTGYETAGWTYDGDKEFDALNFIFDRDLTIVVQYRPIEYKITYNGVAREIANPNPTYYTVESGTITLEALQSYTYDFLGWYLDEECTVAVTAITPDIQNLGNIDIYAKFSSTLTENWWKGITYDETNLRFKMTKNDNNEELSSGCERYLAGTTEHNTDIDDMIDRRNADAQLKTKVTITYDYFDNTADYVWAKSMDRIYIEVSSGSSTAPDIYCNFITDMVSTSFLGSFANLYSSVRGTNYIDVSKDGYMQDLMSSFTLSQDKAYVIASDYFIDIIRAMLVVPVNREMYDRLAPTMPGLEDYNEDGAKDIADFYEEIWLKKWTYERLAQYSAAVYLNTSGLATPNLRDTLGFVLAHDSGLSAAGMVYSTGANLIQKEWNSSKNDYDYSYPEDGTDIISIADALNTLFSSTGVISVGKSEVAAYGDTSLKAIRYQFSNNKILFGGVVTLGSLEYQEYQEMQPRGGFGIAPIPLYKAEGSDDTYVTQIHGVGKAGAISHNTRKFTQCTAFLQYQSTHSTNILHEYYDYNLSYDVAGGVTGNIEILQYIRANVRNPLDSIVEDAIGLFFSPIDAEIFDQRWHSLIRTEKYKMTDMGDKYEELYSKKNEYLQRLIREYERLPN